MLAVEQQQQAFACGEAKVMRALFADVEVLDEIARVDDRVAIGTLDPESLRHAAGLVGRRRNRLTRLFEPCHWGSLAERRTKNEELRTQRRTKNKEPQRRTSTKNVNCVLCSAF